MVAFLCEKLIYGGKLRLKDNIGGRESYRLEGYDYSKEGGYFITIISHARKCIFGDVIRDKVILSAYGEIAQAEWFASKDIRKEIELFNDELVIMPNHLHGIIWIVSNPNDFMLTRKPSKVSVGATGQSPLRLEQQEWPL